MKPLQAFSLDARRRIRGVLCDIDDTLITNRRLMAQACVAPCIGLQVPS